MPTTFEILSPDGSPIFVARLSNERGRGAPFHQYVHDDAELQKFIADYDKPGYAIYHTVAILKDGARRNKENVRATLFVWGEVDFKAHEPAILPDEIIRRLNNIPLRPTFFVFSGHGVHLYWLLREEEDASPGEGQRRIEETLRLIANYIGGDSQVAEAARLMRLPGSHNTRRAGENLPVTLQDVDLNRRYDLAELTDFLLEAHPILPAPTPRPKEGAGTGGGDGSESGMSVEDALEAMRFGGTPCIHYTQLRATAKLVSDGKLVADVVGNVLAATRKAVEGDPNARDWDWQDEERAILQMCLDWINKRKRAGEDFSHTLPDAAHDKWRAIIDHGGQPNVFLNRWGMAVRSAPNGNGNGSDVPNDPNKPTPAQKEAPKEDAPRAPFILRFFKSFDAAALPPREFLFGRHYQRRTVSGTVAPGGTGKSSLVMVEAIAMAAGRDLFKDNSLTERVRVWYHNGEDNMLELNRRLAAICQHYEIPQQELEEWFVMTSGVEIALRVAESYNQVRLQTDHRLVKCITEQIGDNKIAAAKFDPLVTLHGVRESDPGQMDAVIRIFAKIADDQNCAIDLSHHTRKLPPGSNGVDVDIDDMRGAKAVSDAMRMVRILNVMSSRDAEAAGVDELLRTNYFRIDRGKANYSAPAKTAIWRQFVTVPLPNGDDVGVVMPWSFPGQDGTPSPERAEAERKAEHVFLEVLRRLFLAGRFVGEKGTYNAPHVIAKEREAKIAKVGKAALDAAMRRLFDKGKIRIEEYVMANRHPGSRIVEI